MHVYLYRENTYIQREREFNVIILYCVCSHLSGICLQTYRHVFVGNIRLTVFCVCVRVCLCFFVDIQTCLCWKYTPNRVLYVCVCLCFFASVYACGYINQFYSVMSQSCFVVSSSYSVLGPCTYSRLSHSPCFYCALRFFCKMSQSTIFFGCMHPGSY